MLSRTRVSELLDYASVYGDFDETTPNGVSANLRDTIPMNEYRRTVIICYKKVLGLLPIDYGFEPAADPMEDVSEF